MEKGKKGQGGSLIKRTRANVVAGNINVSQRNRLGFLIGA